MLSLFYALISMAFGFYCTGSFYKRGLSTFIRNIGICFIIMGGILWHFQINEISNMKVKCEKKFKTDYVKANACFQFYKSW